MKIAIVYPAHGVISVVNQPNIKAVADNYGIYPNTSLAYVAGALKKAGHEVIFLDAAASGYSLNDMVLHIKRFDADLMLFTITTYLYHQIIELIDFFKERHDCPVIVGGAHLSLYPKETLMNDSINYGVIGEAEETIVELVGNIEQKNKKFEDIKGVVFRKNDKVIITKPRPLIKDLDSLAFPARNLLPMKKYYSFISKYKNYTTMITSRGCTFGCTFCEQRTGKVRYRSPKNVVDEIEECYTKYHVREIDFFDPLFTINKKRVIEICKEIISRKINVAWSCRSRVDTIDEEMLKIMKKAGCYRIYYGIESGDERILKIIGKNTNLKQIKKSIRITKKYRILAFGYFMIGNPGDTKKSIIRTIKLSKKLPLDYAQFSRSSILPGTKMYEDWMKKYGFDYWEDYIKDRNAEREMKRPDTNLADKQLDFFIKKAYKGFYFRPIQVLRIIRQIKSLEEFKRYARAGISMIFN